MARHYDAPTLDSNPPATANTLADRAELWLATSAAAEHFDPNALIAAERARYDGIRRAKTHRDFAVSRALLAHLKMDSPPKGRLSHSGGVAALLLTNRDSAVGVDVERHTARRFTALARFAFTDQEAAAVESVEGAERERLFYALWTLKEAYAKALQRPLLDAIRHCSFRVIGRELHGTVPDDRPWRAKVFEPRPGVTIAAAFVGEDIHSNVRTHAWPPEREERWPEPFQVITSAPRSL